MDWLTGLKRLRLVATAALVLGAVLCASVVITHGLGFSPDTFIAPLFAAMWPIGLALILTGALLWVAVWVLHGFLPRGTAGARSVTSVRRDHLDP